MSRLLSNLGKKKAPPCRLPMLVPLASPRFGERCREATERGRCLEITSTTGRRYGGLSCSLNVFGGICGTRGRGGAKIGRPQTTLDDIPANFLWHYPAYKNGAFNLTELARLCDISRTTTYKYIGLLEG